MDSIFGIGAPELLVILIMAGVVMGPQRMYQAARWLGRVTAQLQTISRQFARQLASELEDVDRGGDMKKALDEVKVLRQQIADLKKEVGSVATATAKETENSIGDIRRNLQPNLSAQNKQTGNGTAVSLPKPLSVEDDPE